jgi:hypothetical protein
MSFHLPELSKLWTVDVTNRTSFSTMAHVLYNTVLQMPEQHCSLLAAVSSLLGQRCAHSTQSAYNAFMAKQARCLQAQDPEATFQPPLNLEKNLLCGFGLMQGNPTARDAAALFKLLRR